MTAGDFVLGIDFGGTKIAVATAGPDGSLLKRQEMPTDGPRGAEQALERAVRAGQSLIEETRGPGDGRLLGVGVATMGVTEEHRVFFAPNVPGWDQLAIPGAIRSGFDTEAVRIENDVKAATAAELRWGALSGVNTGVYLNLGTGIATGLVANGHVLRGAHGAAGEIAYNLRHPHDELGAQHGRAPLEEYAGGKALVERARVRFGEGTDIGQTFAGVATDPEARAFVEETLSEIAFHVTNLAIALDPERIVVGGGMLRSKSVIIPHLQAHVRRFVPFPPDVLTARFSIDAALMGAIALALDATAAC